MKISVLIPTFKRPHDLERCLNALKIQTKAAEQVIVTIRDIDNESWTFFNHYDCENLVLELVKVFVPGVVAALNQGLEKVNGDILAITDDDAKPYPDWLEKMDVHYNNDPRLGALGGKDWMYVNGHRIEKKIKVIGKIQWFGRAIGNHPFGCGNAREVDVLKGVNMSFRTKAMGNLKFDSRMLGQGAQVHFEMSYCLAIKRANWKIIYDPNLQVNHYLAVRHDQDQRGSFHPTAKFNAVYNETLIILEHLTMIQQICFIIWLVFVGHRDNRGFIQMLRFLPFEGILAIYQWIIAIRGQWSAWKFHQRHSLKPEAVQFTEG